MRFLLSMWVTIIFIITCTKNVYLLFEGKIEFVLAQDPNWSYLFALHPWRDVSKIEFIGHFFMFFTLTAFLVAIFRNIIGAVVMAFLYGVVTELVQPFFSRGAEAIDLLANTSGILSLFILYAIGKMAELKVKGLELKNGHTRIPF